MWSFCPYVGPQDGRVYVAILPILGPQTAWVKQPLLITSHALLDQNHAGPHIWENATYPPSFFGPICIPYPTVGSTPCKIIILSNVYGQGWYLQTQVFCWNWSLRYWQNVYVSLYVFFVCFLDTWVSNTPPTHPPTREVYCRKEVHARPSGTCTEDLFEFLSVLSACFCQGWFSQLLPDLRPLVDFPPPPPRTLNSCVQSNPPSQFA